MPGFKGLKDLDFYRKIEKDYTVGTASGGSISIFASVFLFVLFVLEFNSYLTVTRETQIVMDTSTDSTLDIHFDMTLQHIPCRFVTLDVYDVMRTTRTNVTKNVVRYRVDSATNQWLGAVEDKVAAPKYDDKNPTEHPGHKEGEKLAVELQKGELTKFIKEHDMALVNFYAPWCIWCQRLHPVWEHTAGLIQVKYGKNIQFANIDCTHPDHQKDCEDQHINAYPTIIIYRNGNGHSHEHYHGDRTSEAFMKFVSEILAKDSAAEVPKVADDGTIVSDGAKKGAVRAEGCRIAGKVTVNKVPGNLLMSVHSEGHSFNEDAINLSHRVDILQFGERLGEPEKAQLPEEVMTSVFRLNNQKFLSDESGASHEHYIKVVGQNFLFVDGSELDTYTYSSNSQTYIDKAARPAAKFTYDLTPMSVVTTEVQMPFYHFLTSLCAIIGGVFTVMGLIDSVVYHSVNALKKKMELGKDL